MHAVTDLIPSPWLPVKGGSRCTALIFLQGRVDVYHIKLTFKIIQIKHVYVALKIPENKQKND